MVEIINSLEDLCRLCAGKIDILMGINIFESDSRQIFKKICVCLPIQISVDDSFPKMVCVECACKLDLMFDFRERSILTAHLFSDMMTVNSGNVITIHQNVPLDGHTATDFSEEFVSSKLDPVKYVNNQLTTEVCSAGSQVILHENIDLEDSSNLLRKSKEKVDVRQSNNVSEVKCTESDVDSQVEVPITVEREPTERPKVFVETEQQVLERPLSCESHHSIRTNLEIETLNLTAINQNENDINAQLDWFFCDTCNRTFTDKGEFDVHHHEQLSNGTSVSFNEKESSTEVLPNKKKKTKEKRVASNGKDGEKKSDSKVCTECGKQYQTNYKLQEHMRKHTGEKPYTCSYENCRKTFRSKIGLAQHEANHSGQFEFSCSTCGKGFQCRSYLVVHQRVHSDVKPYVCKQCSRKFKTKQSLLDHMNRHLGVKPFLCDICGRGFITKGLCKSHQRVHSGTDNRQYPCNVCRKLFVSKSYLNTHFRIHTGEKPFMCEVCGKGFLTRVDLRIHSTMHTGEKSFVCEMCGKAFARRDALRCHRRSHTGERPYKCEFCGQSFTQFSPMAIHKRLHTGERPYKCDVCHKAFVSRSTMISHKKKHHSAPGQDSTESQFQFVAVEVPQEDVSGGQVEQSSSQHLMVIENNSQFLLTLSKRDPSDESSSESRKGKNACDPSNAVK